MLIQQLEQRRREILRLHDETARKLEISIKSNGRVLEPRGKRKGSVNVKSFSFATDQRDINTKTQSRLQKLHDDWQRQFPFKPQTRGAALSGVSFSKGDMYDRQPNKNSNREIAVDEDQIVSRLYRQGIRRQKKVQNELRQKLDVRYLEESFSQINVMQEEFEKICTFKPNGSNPDTQATMTWRGSQNRPHYMAPVQVAPPVKHISESAIPCQVFRGKDVCRRELEDLRESSTLCRITGPTDEMKLAKLYISEPAWIRLSRVEATLFSGSGKVSEQVMNIEFTYVHFSDMGVIQNSGMSTKSYLRPSSAPPRSTFTSSEHDKPTKKPSNLQSASGRKQKIDEADSHQWDKSSSYRERLIDSQRERSRMSFDSMLEYLNSISEPRGPAEKGKKPRADDDDSFLKRQEEFTKLMEWNLNGFAESPTTKSGPARSAIQNDKEGSKRLSLDKKKQDKSAMRGSYSWVEQLLSGSKSLRESKVGIRSKNTDSDSTAREQKRVDLAEGIKKENSFLDRVERWRQERQDRMRDLFMKVKKEHTFKPKINARSVVKSPRSLQDLSEGDLRRKMEIRENLSNEQLEKEVYPFKPSLNQRPAEVLVLFFDLLNESGTAQSCLKINQEPESYVERMRSRQKSLQVPPPPPFTPRP
eukprot:767903-Hanusia_phi.AAC.3